MPSPDALSIILNLLSLSWWFLLFLVLFPIFESSWLAWRQIVFKNDIAYVLLEIRMPREIHKSPRAMEQVLMAMHNLRNSPGNIQEKWWDGETTTSYSLEMVSFGGEAHFYMRIPVKQKAIVESAFFSYYPDAEIAEVEDYVSRLPADFSEMENQKYDIWGTEMILSKESAYPIKSYLDFESPDEEKQYDPISAIIEVFGKMKGAEMAMVQIIIAPADNKTWKDSGKKILEEFQTKPGASGDTSGIKIRTPGQTDAIKAIEENLARPGFDTVVRMGYLAPKDIFSSNLPKKGMVGAFNQYATNDLNSFKNNGDMETKTNIWGFPHIFPSRRLLTKKARALYNLRGRIIPPETFIGKLITSSFWDWDFKSKRVGLGVRSLATVFHPPTHMVLTAPHMKRVESKKAGPPAGLAIFGDESEIERYM